VLNLWSACVTHFLHNHLSWSSCLSVGKAISAICAVSKGRSIGVFEKVEETEERRKEKEERRRRGAGVEGGEGWGVWVRVGGEGCSFEWEDDGWWGGGAERQVWEDV